jgi:hypothetical protein
MRRPAFKALNALAKRRHGGNVDRRIHALLLSVSQASRSLFVLTVPTVNGHARGSACRSARQ